MNITNKQAMYSLRGAMKGNPMIHIVEVIPLLQMKFRGSWNRWIDRTGYGFQLEPDGLLRTIDPAIVKCEPRDLFAKAHPKRLISICDRVAYQISHNYIKMWFLSREGLRYSNFNNKKWSNHSPFVCGAENVADIVQAMKFGIPIVGYDLNVLNNPKDLPDNIMEKLFVN